MTDGGPADLWCADSGMAGSAPKYLIVSKFGTIHSDTQFYGNVIQVTKNTEDWSQEEGRKFDA